WWPRCRAHRSRRPSPPTCSAAGRPTCPASTTRTAAPVTGWCSSPRASRPPASRGPTTSPRWAAAAPRTERLLPPRVGRLLQQIATQQRQEADRIAASMFAAYAEEIPAYAQIGDPALREDVESVSAAMVRAWLEVMSTGRPITAEALEPLLQGARRRAAQGVDLHSMLRAYRVGVRVMWSELVGTPEWQSHALQAATVHVAEWALDFADRVYTEVAAVYLDELAHVARRREHRRSALLNVLLAGPGGESVEAPRELDQPHAVVVGRVDEDTQLDTLERVGSALEGAVDAVLWTMRHRSVIAAVPLPAGGRAALVRRLDALLPIDGVGAFGVGGNARGAVQTRQSYSEAVDTLRVGAVLGRPGLPVHDYQEMAPAIALLQRPDQARRFAATALEPLGALVERPWVLPTPEAYLSRQGRIKEAATQLGVHLNTVKYRLREVRAAAGAGFGEGERAATLLLALKLHRLLSEEATRATSRSGAAPWSPARPRGSGWPSPAGCAPPAPRSWPATSPESASTRSPPSSAPRRSPPTSATRSRSTASPRPPEMWTSSSTTRGCSTSAPSRTSTSRA